MSLTSFLRENKDVREQFRREFQKPKISIKKYILAKPLSGHYSLVGTSFDYLLRFYLQRLNSNSVIKEYWVAEIAVDILGIIDLKKYNKASKIIVQAKKYLKKYLKTGQITDELIKHALLLGQLDPVYRAFVVQDKFGFVYQKDIKDMKKLISIVEPSIFKARDVCLLNPTFGNASSLVGGADADLLIDDTLIDIKTTKKLELKEKDFQQLLGYYILHRIGGIGKIKPKLKINNIAIYFSRYSYLLNLKVDDIVNKRTLTYFIKWFKCRARNGKSIKTNEALIELTTRRNSNQLSLFKSVQAIR
jgi:hypothetical protein